MGRVTIFDRIKNTLRGQNSSFCSRATRVSVLGGEQPTPGTSFTYIDCNGRLSNTTYKSIIVNGGYIPDCVQGGSPITTELNVRLFVEYGTTNCEIFPPVGGNVILQVCNQIGEGLIVDTTGYNLVQGGVYQIQLASNVPGPFIPQQCYTVSGSTDLPASYVITGQVLDIGDCTQCRR